MAHSPLRLDWPLDLLRRELGALRPGMQVEVVPEIGSTSTELMQRVRDGLAAPLLLAAERQTAGRGRMGRNWQSEVTAPGPGPEQHAPADAAAPDALPSLTFSMALPLAPADWSGLSLAVGVAVAGSLHPDIGLKWPNDLWVQDRKLGGILIETAAQGATPRHVVIGIGLNLLPRTVQGASTPPAFLRQMLPGVAAPAVLERVAPAVLQAVLRFEQEGFAPFRADFAARDVLRGRVVVLSDGSTGEAEGVDANGLLRVRTRTGLQSVGSNEVSVRPAALAATLPPMR
jgi:BirA family biotin operon repressor/biotin-[acetyl-CoA-carboxylase] ligase